MLVYRSVYFRLEKEEIPTTLMRTKVAVADQWLVYLGCFTNKFSPKQYPIVMYTLFINMWGDGIYPLQSLGVLNYFSDNLRYIRPDLWLTVHLPVSC